MRGFGVITNIYKWNGLDDFTEVVRRAKDLGYSALELGPAYTVTESTIDGVKEAGLEVSDLIYCRNLLSPDRSEAEEHRRAAIDRVRLAGATGIPVVVLCGGYADPCADLHAKDSYATVRRPPIENLEPFLREYGPVIEEAEKRDVRIAFEHCPLMGNWLIAPDLWNLAFDRLGSDRVGLCFDPSHLIWLFIDVPTAYEEFADRIFHIHAKDTEVYQSRLGRAGILADFSWWEGRLPGSGDLNWTRFFALVKQKAYGGYISVEHEDPTWTGSVERVDTGLSYALSHMKRAWEEADYYDDSSATVRNE